MTQVNIDVLAVPDRAEKYDLRIAVQLVPSALTHSSGTIDADKWPEEIATRVSKVRLWIAPLQNGQIGQATPHELTPDLPGLYAAMVAGQTQQQLATDLWKQIFPKGTDWAKILGILRPAAPKLSATLRDAGHDAVLSADTVAVEEYLDKLYQREKMRSYSARVGKVATLKERVTQAKDAKSKPGQALPGADIFIAQETDCRDWLNLAPDLDVQAHGKTYLSGLEAKRLARSKFVQALDAAQNVSALLKDLPNAAREERRQFSAQFNAELAQFMAGVSGNKPAIREALGTFAVALAGSTEPDPMSLPPPEDEPVLDEVGQRKLGMILSFPTLAKYLALCVDLRVAETAFGALSEGVLAVELRPASGQWPQQQPDDLCWTAFSLIRQNKRVVYFGPLPGDKGTYAADFYANGLLNLAHKDGTEPSFVLSSKGTPNTFARLTEKTELMSSRILSGRAALNDPEPMPSQSTRGLVLLDRHAKERYLSSLVGEHLQANDPGPTINYAQQLEQGLRYDVLLEPQGAVRGATNGWRPLMERNVSFVHAGLKAFMEYPAVLQVQYRDNAISAAPPEKTQTAGLPRDWVPQEKLIWGGGSLAVSASDMAIEASDQDVPLDITFGLPDVKKEPTRCPPPLRLGRKYHLRARIAYPLGCGLTFEDVAARPLNDEAATLAGDFTYKRWDEVNGPIVLFPWDSPLVTESDAAPPPDPGKIMERATPSIERMVVGTDWKRKEDLRFLLPPRISIDEAEQQGQFDKNQVDPHLAAPRGAFEQSFKIALFGPEGRLPDARGGEITWLQENGHLTVPLDRRTSSDLAKAQVRGQVMVIDPKVFEKQRDTFDNDDDDLPQPRYYADKMAREVVASLEPVTGFSPTFAQKSFQFWKTHPRDALPVRLQLKAAGPDMVAEFVGPDIVRARPPGPVDVRLSNLAIAIGPGEMVDLHLFVSGTSKEIQEGHGAYRSPQQLLNHLKSNKQASVSEQVAIPQVARSRVIRLVHPVAKPLMPPKFIGRPQRYTVTVSPETAQEPHDARAPKWSELAAKPDLLASQEGGAATFFTGKIELCARTSSSLRVDAFWNEYTQDTVKKNPSDGLWFEDVLAEHARLFQVELQPVESTLDLLSAPDHQFRALNYAFKDGRARNLSLLPVATSRFANFYDPVHEDSTDPRHVGIYERAGAYLNDYWIDCTFRPPVPKIDRALPIFYWSKDTPKNNLWRFSRKASIRLFLDADWYSSGEGEKLAILFDSERNRDVCAYQTDSALQPFARVVTRWGRDAIRTTASASVTDLGPANIIGTTTTKNLRLYADSGDAKAGSGATSTLSVEAVVIKPTLDPDLGLYCDLDIGLESSIAKNNRANCTCNPEPFLTSYMPFVQLGLARYQEHALMPTATAPETADLRLSHAIEQTVQLLPYRFGEVRIIGRRRVQVILGGQSYAYKDPKAGPRLSIRLLERENGASYPNEDYYWVPTTSKGQEVALPNLLPGIKPKILDAPGGTIWGVEFELPLRAEDPDYAVQIEEYEWLPSNDPDAKEKLVRRGPIFATTVELTQ